MILKTGCSTFNCIFWMLLFIFHFCFCLQGNACEAFALHNGVIYLDSNTSLPVNGTVLDFTAINNRAILYVARSEKEVTAGAYLLDEKKSIVCVVASINESSEVKRIAFDPPVVYISIHDSTNCYLYRADVNIGIVQQKKLLPILCCWTADWRCLQTIIILNIMMVSCRFTFCQDHILKGR